MLNYLITLRNFGKKFSIAKFSGLEWRPINTIDINSEDDANKLLTLLEKLEELDDVQNIASNFNINDVLMEKIDLSKNNLILGVDPGLNITGWGLVEKKKNKDIYIAHGSIKSDKKEDLGFRLNRIYEEISQKVEIYSPNSIAIEKIFANKNPDSTLKLGKARAMIFLVAAKKEHRNFEYSPNTIKKNLVGYGHASKKQIIDMIKRFFPEITIDDEDSADALR